MASKSPTMRDVAQFAGVSVQTVSCVINETGSISTETRDRVWEAVKALQYKPNRVARSMRTGQTRLIALLVMDITNPVLSMIASNVEAAAYSQNYSVLLYNVGSDAVREQAYLNAAALADGVIIVNAIDHPRTLRLLENYRPTVLVDCVTTPDIASVSVDNVQGGCLATEHLIQLGHQRIAHIGGAADLEIARQRARGYRQALQDAGLNSETIIFSPTNRWDYAGGYQAAEALFEREERFTAIFAASDQLAFGAYRLLAERGLKVPDDISIVGFDNTELAAFTTPPLTTIHQPLEDIAGQAFRLLLTMMDDSVLVSSQILLPPQLIVRQSTRRLS